MTWLDTSVGDPPEDGWYRFKGPGPLSIRAPTVHELRGGMVIVLPVQVEWERLATKYPLGMTRYWPEPIGFQEGSGMKLPGTDGIDGDLEDLSRYLATLAAECLPIARDMVPATVDPKNRLDRAAAMAMEFAMALYGLAGGEVGGLMRDPVFKARVTGKEMP